MRIYNEEDVADDSDDENSPGAIVIEALSNIRTVASLSLETKYAAEFVRLLRLRKSRTKRKSLFQGLAAGFGQSVQFWGKEIDRDKMLGATL